MTFKSLKEIFESLADTVKGFSGKSESINMTSYTREGLRFLRLDVNAKFLLATIVNAKIEDNFSINEISLVYDISDSEVLTHQIDYLIEQGIVKNSENQNYYFVINEFVPIVSKYISEIVKKV